MTASRTTSAYGSLRVLLLSHYATTAMQDFLKLYLNNHKIAHLTVVNFPLPEIPLLTHIEVYDYECGTEISRKKITTVVHPGSLAYVAHFFQAFWLICTLQSRPYSLVIAQNSMLAMASLCGRYLGKVKKVVFYSHGISKKRFGFSLINQLYRVLDQFVYEKSNANWALSKEIFKNRVILKDKPIQIVPASVPVSMFPLRKKQMKPTLVFIGALNHMNGADMLPKILTHLKAQGKFYMDIIGVGPEESAIQTYVHEHSLDEQVRLMGYQDIFHYASSLSQYFCGLAPYRNDDASLLSSTDPMKIQLYAAAGLPTIVTKGYVFSERIRAGSLGMSVAGDPQAFAEAVVRLYKNAKDYQSMSKKSRSYAQQNDIYTIYEREFKLLL